MFYDEKEIREAINAGNHAFESFNKALEQFDKASKWGIVDILGGGMIASLVKRNILKKANEYVQQAKNSLEIFNRELRDVDMFDELKIETDDFIGITDLLFDNVFSDLATQKRIKDSIEDINLAMDKIEAILDRLESMLV